MADGFLPPVVATLTADISQFQAKMAEARAETSSMASQGSAGVERFAAVGKAALLGLGGAFVAVGAIGVKMALDAQVNQARLSQAIKNTGHDWSEYADRIDSVRAKSRDLGFSGGDVTQSLAKLVPVTHDTNKALDLMGLAEDIARGRHIELSAATDILAKVETGRVGLLGRLGISTKDATGATISQEEAVRRLSDMYGGQASAYADTFQGKLAILEAQAKYLVTTFGQALLPAISGVAGGLADGVNWLDRNREAAQALAVVIGGPLVAAMGLYAAEQLAIGWGKLWVMAGNLSARVTTLGDSLTATGQYLLALGPATLLATGGLLAVGAAIVYLESQDGVFERNTDAAKKWGDTIIAAAKGGGHELQSLEQTHKELDQEIQVHQSHITDLQTNYAKYGLTIDQANEKALHLGYSTDLLQQKDKLVTSTIADLRQEHQKQLVAADAVAKSYGVEIPNASKMSSDALKQVQGAIKSASGEFSQSDIQAALWADNTGAALQSAATDANAFQKSISDAFARTTDPFQHFGDQAVVTEGDMQTFFLGSNLKAQDWSNELTGIINRIRTELPAGTRDAVTGLVQEMAKAGPDSKPALDAFIQMVDQNGVQWVNSIAQSSANAQASVDAAYNEMAINAAIKSAEFAAIGKASFQDLEEGGTRHLEALLGSSDKNLGQMAYGAVLNLGQIRGGIESIPTDFFTTFHADASQVWAAVQSAKQALAQLPAGFTGGADLLTWTLDHPGQPLPGAHGLVGLARGGSAGMIVGPHQPVLIGEGLSREAVVPFDNFGDMVATIKNTGRASDFYRAAMAAGGIPQMIGRSSSAGAGGSGGGGTSLKQDTRIVFVNSFDDALEHVPGYARPKAKAAFRNGRKR